MLNETQLEFPPRQVPFRSFKVVILMKIPCVKPDPR